MATTLFDHFPNLVIFVMYIFAILKSPEELARIEQLRKFEDER